MGRKVTISMGAICNTEERDTIHQVVAIQLSVGDAWVPSTPLVIPNVESAGSKISQHVKKIAGEVHDAVEDAAGAGASISDLTSVGETPTPKGRIFSFGFETDADEIDFGLTGLDREGNGGLRRGKTQLGLSVTVGEGRSGFHVKEYPGARIWKAVRKGGWSTRGGRDLRPGRATPYSPHRVPRGGKTYGHKLASFLLTGAGVYIDQWTSPGLPFWGDRRGLEPWDIDAILAGYYPAPVRDILSPRLLSWADAMSAGRAALRGQDLLHWSPVHTGDSEGTDEEGDLGHDPQASLDTAWEMQPEAAHQTYPV